MERPIEIRVVSDGSAQWNSFFTIYESLFGNTLPSQMNHKIQEISPGRTETIIKLNTSITTEYIRSELEKSTVEVVMIFCPNERPNVGKKRRRRRDRGLRKAQRAN